MICVSLSGLSFQECIKAIGKSEFAEIRMDQLDLSHDQFKSLFSLKQKTIATCRSGALSDLQRMTLLKMAVDAGAGYIDIEYESEPKYRTELENYAHSRKTLVIISYHNFDATPPLARLKSIIDESVSWHADRVKITTMAETPTDASVVMSLYAYYDHLIAFCMGKPGRITRIAAPMLGAEFTYAAWTKNLATAPGQLTVDELDEIFEIIS